MQKFRPRAWQAAIILIAAIAYIPQEVRNRDKVWRFEHIPGISYSKPMALHLLAEIDRELMQAKSVGRLSVRDGYRIEEQLNKIMFGTNFPRSFYIHGIRSYSEESEVGDEVYWSVYHYQTITAMLMRQWTAGQRAAYDKLRSRPEVRHIWNPVLREFPRSRNVDDLLGWRVSMAMLIMLIFLGHKMAAVGLVIRRLFSRKTLQLAGSIISLAVAMCAMPAVAVAQILANAKKRISDGSATEEPLVRVPAPTLPPVTELKLEAFGDDVDRQQFAVLSHRIASRVSLVVFNQNRQSGTGPGSFSHLGLGARLRLFGSRLTLTSTTGPQYEWTKGQADQWVTFASGSIKTQQANLTMINRLSRGLVPAVAPAHRHIAFGRLRPMPEWLSAWGEFKHVRGQWTENFWGPMVTYGRLLPKRFHRWFGGAYVWPYYDFARQSYHVRLGYSANFSLAQ